MYINRITNFNGNYNNSIQPQETKQQMTDEQVANKIEEIIQNEVKKGEFLYGSTGAIKKADNWLKDKDIYYNYLIRTNNSPEKLEEPLKTFFYNNKDLTITNPIIKTFESYDKYDNINRTIYIEKKIEPYRDTSVESKWEDENGEFHDTSPIDLADFGTRTVPLEYIELAYKDVEKLAKLGFGDEKFLWSLNPANKNSIPSWPNLNWKILPSGKLLSSSEFYFRKLGPYDSSGNLETLESWTASIKEWLKQEKDPKIIKELQEELKEKTENFYKFKKERDKELEPGFVDKYLKAWKEEMLKVNKLGLDRYRYEKYGRTH